MIFQRLLPITTEWQSPLKPSLNKDSEYNVFREARREWSREVDGESFDRKNCPATDPGPRSALNQTDNNQHNGTVSYIPPPKPKKAVRFHEKCVTAEWNAHAKSEYDRRGTLKRLPRELRLLEILETALFHHVDPAGEPLKLTQDSMLSYVNRWRVRYGPLGSVGRRYVNILCDAVVNNQSQQFLAYKMSYLSERAMHYSAASRVPGWTIHQRHTGGAPEFDPEVIGRTLGFATDTLQQKPQASIIP